MPAICVVLPVYNAEKTLSAALDSILSQDFADYSVIVVDDGSTDTTPAILENYTDTKILVLTNEQNRGIEYSLNRGVTAADCDYIVRMDSDDVSVPERFSAQVKFFEQNSKVWVLGSWAELLHADGSSSLACTPLTNDAIRSRLFFHAPFVHPSVAIRRFVFDKIKYSDKYPAAEDFELWSRLALVHDCRMENLPLALLKYRFYGPTISLLQKEKQQQSSSRVRAKFLQRFGILDTNCISLHNAVAEHDYRLPVDWDFVERLEHWFDLLLKRNRELKYCDQRCMCKEFKERYLILAEHVRDLQPDVYAQMQSRSKVFDGAGHVF